MKTRFTIYSLTLLMLAASNVLAQVPGIQWNHGYGTDVFDEFESMVSTNDGGYILGGSTAGGVYGSKSEPSKGATDYWIIKIDANGKKQWDKDFGGLGFDYLHDLDQTTDGGYILGGKSNSVVGGDKTEATMGAWVIKTDSNGIKQWDKSFDSGSASDLHSVQQTTDGGYVFGGEVIDNGYDYWVVKLNASGDLEWEEKLGGSQDDNLHFLQQTTDGGYILGGISASGISGDKTQPCFGQSDYWIVKLDGNGEKEWDADFGGTDAEYLWSLQQTDDEGYILFGESYSKINGNKTKPNKGLTDYWAVKVDANGIKEWDADFGGSDYEYGRAITQTADGGYLLAGSSKSGISGDKTQPTYGATDYWLVKTDANGVFEWDNRIGGHSFDDLGSIMVTNDDGYIIGGNSNSQKGYDKTQQSYGSADFWIVKLSFVCTIPSSPSSTDVTASSAKLSWDAMSGAIGYKVSYREVTNPAWSTVSSAMNEITLNGLNASTDYVWKVKSVCNAAPLSGSGWCAKQYFTTGPLKLSDGESSLAVTIYPNPFSDRATIQFSLETNSNLKIELLDLQGRKIKIITEGIFSEGNHQLQVEKQNLPSGIYLIQLKTGSGILNQKFIIQ